MMFSPRAFSLLAFAVPRGVSELSSRGKKATAFTCSNFASQLVPLRPNVRASTKLACGAGPGQQQNPVSYARRANGGQMQVTQNE
jgi:hypothetical protein